MFLIFVLILVLYKLKKLLINLIADKVVYGIKFKAFLLKTYILLFHSRIAEGKCFTDFFSAIFILLFFLTNLTLLNLTLIYIIINETFSYIINLTYIRSISLILNHINTHLNNFIYLIINAGL